MRAGPDDKLIEFLHRVNRFPNSDSSTKWRNWSTSRIQLRHRRDPKETLDMTFTPIHSLLGGCILGASVYSALVLQGVRLGCSGFFHSCFRELVNGGKKGITEWKWAMVAGFVTSGAVLRFFDGNLTKALGITIFDKAPLLGGDLYKIVIAGVLVGLGTRLANGCTSGHMLSGLSRLSKRSFVATGVFFPTAVITANYLDTIPKYAGTAAIQSMSTTLPSPLTAISLTLIPYLLYAHVIPALGVSSKLKSIMASFLMSFHFGIGLALAGMTQTSKVLSFFKFPGISNNHGAWDPSLMMVVVGGLLPNLVLWQVQAKKLKAAKFGGPIDVSTSNKIDTRLVLGSLLFGIGWGFSGICPGPAMTNAVNAGFPLFLGAMGVGGLLADTF